MRPDLDATQLVGLVADAMAFERLLTVYDALDELVLRPGLPVADIAHAARGERAMPVGLGIIAVEDVHGDRAAALELEVRSWERSDQTVQPLPEAISGIRIVVTQRPGARSSART